MLATDHTTELSVLEALEFEPDDQACDFGRHAEALADVCNNAPVYEVSARACPSCGACYRGVVTACVPCWEHTEDAGCVQCETRVERDRAFRIVRRLA